MRRHIQFLRRGSVVRLDDAAPTLTLLDYLRLSERAMGTKEGCAEGDCGACTVVLRRLVGGRLVYSPVNACIVLAGQADGSEVISVDDLAVDGLHPVNLGKLVLGTPGPLPCTPAGIVELLHAHDVPVQGRHVAIIGRGVTIGRPLANLLTLKRPGCNAAVTVVHTGVDPADMGRLFNAFFTTRANGMGMGLSICRSIIESYGGRIWAANNAGPGTIFQFALPLKAQGTS